MESPQPPPVPKEAAARAWGDVRDESAPTTLAPPRPQPRPRPPAAPIPEATEPRDSRKKWLIAIAPAVVLLILIGAVVFRGGGGGGDGDSGSTGQDSKGGAAASPSKTANVDEVKKKFPLLAARLAPLNLQPGRPDALVLPMPYELRPENTGAGWQFGVEQFFAIRGVDPNRPAAAPIGGTAFDDVTIDGFTEPAGATRMRDAYVGLRTSQGQKLVEKGDAKKPARLHNEVSGMVTTSFFFESGNTFVRFVNVCRMCSPDVVDKEVKPVLEAIRTVFPQGT